MDVKISPMPMSRNLTDCHQIEISDMGWFVQPVSLPSLQWHPLCSITSSLCTVHTGTPPPSASKMPHLFVSGSRQQPARSSAAGWCCSE